MPSVLIEVRRQYSVHQESELIEAVHRALRTAFSIPANDRNLRLVVHEPHRFVCAAGEDEEYFTQITIDAFPGRSLDAKRNVYRTIIDNLKQFGIPAHQITVLIRENTRENWGIRGGQAACDVELGFNVSV
jgi:phenylpyruvate tautomerase PptA (4-oxalocrotonate tautomerase family)